MSSPPLQSSLPPINPARRESFARRAESLLEQVIPLTHSIRSIEIALIHLHVLLFIRRDFCANLNFDRKDFR